MPACRFANRAFALAGIGRAAALAGLRRVQPSQSLERCRVGFRAFHDRTGGERRDTKIDTNYRGGLYHRLHIVRLDHQADEPAAAFEGHRGALEPAGEAHGLAHPHPADGRKLDALAVGATGAGLVGGAERSPIALALEPRIFAALREKGAERGTQIDDRWLS
jgi:hypothetical protein